MDRHTLEEYEPKMARLFLNSRKSQRLSSAYLLHGPENAPLKEVAMYLSESLGCENDLLACNECNSCKRFLEGITPDFMLIDGQKDMIRKGDIQALEKKFSLSVYEKGHTLSYVIHRVDNINNEAANALLKFLEEPKVGQVAFLTTTNLDKVLPTIRSRSISIRIDPIDPKGLQKKLMENPITISEEGKKAKNVHLTAVEAYILSRHFATMDEVLLALNENIGILDGISAGESFLYDYVTSFKTGAFTLLKETTILKEGKCYNWMYLTVLDTFQSVLLNEDDPDNPLRDTIHDLQMKRDEIASGIEMIKDMMSHKNLNYNATLQAGRFLNALNKEKK